MAIPVLLPVVPVTPDTCVIVSAIFGLAMSGYSMRPIRGTLYFILGFVGAFGVLKICSQLGVIVVILNSPVHLSGENPDDTMREIRTTQFRWI